MSAREHRRKPVELYESDPKGGPTIVNTAGIFVG